MSRFRVLLGALPIAFVAALLVASPGSGAASSPPLKPNPQDVIFAQTDVGNSASKAVTLTNTTAAPITVSKLLVYGFNQTDFAVAADQCTTKTVAAAGTCTFNVTFTPLATAEKQETRVAHLRVDSNAACPSWLTLAGSTDGKTTPPNTRQTSTCPEPTATASPAPSASASPSPSPTPAGGVQGFVGGGTNSVCPGRSKVRINFHTGVRTRLKLKTARVKVGGRTFKVKRNKKRLHKVRGYYYSVLNFKGLTAPRYKVKVRGTLTNGKKFARNRVFKNCITGA